VVLRSATPSAFNMLVSTLGVSLTDVEFRRPAQR
jgi:hypothetical protein